MENEEEEKYCSNCKRSVAVKNFAIHSAFCERNIFVCKICKEPVGINEKDEHFENYHVISPCNLCEAPIEKWMLPEHMEICPKRLIVCEYCEAEFPLNEHTDHIEFCGSRTEKCLLCQKYIMMKDKARHTELHKCEQKYHKKKIEEEIKQNKVNEVISSIKSSDVEKNNSEDSSRRDDYRKEDPQTRMGANFERMKESVFDRGSPNSKRMQDLGMLSLQGATALPDRAKEKSSRYGECHICKQSIPWIDMNTHIPSCASLAGKCSLCGEDVPNSAMKDHMRQHIPGLTQKQSFRAPENISSERSSFFAQNVSNHAMKNRITEHVPGSFRDHSNRASESRTSYIRKGSSDHDQNDAAKKIPLNDRQTDGNKSTSINEYECPLCLKTVPRKDKNRHEVSDCPMLQDSAESNSYFSRSVSQSYHECPACSEKVPEENWQSHVSFDCKMLLQRSSSCDASSKRSDSSEIYECPYCLAWMPEKDIKKHELFECETLIACSGVQIPEQQKSYADVAQKTCQCTCRKKTNNCGKCNKTTHYCDNSQQKMHKGTIPKKQSIREMMQPASGKCKYCNTSLNMDILKYHEDECVHLPVDCPDCQRKIPIKDLDNHECKKKKKKGMKRKEDQPSPEKKPEFGLLRRMGNYIGVTSSNEETDKKEIMNRHHSYSNYDYPYHRQVSNTDSHDFYFEDPKLPCEFCNKQFPASQLVLHETGCEPDLVTCAKQKSSASPMKESNIRSSFQGLEQPFFPENSVLTSDRKKHERKFGSKPGEFLEYNYEKSSSTNCERTRKESKQKKEETTNFQSVWNDGSYNEIEDCSDQVLKHVQDSKDVDKFNEPCTLKSNHTSTTKHRSEFMSQSSNQMMPEDEMNGILNFLDEDRNKKFDQVYEDESEVNEKRAEPIKLASYSAFGSNSPKDHLLQKNHKDCLDEKNASIDEESSGLFKKTTISGNHSSIKFAQQLEDVRKTVQKLKKLRLDTLTSAAMSCKQIPVEVNLLEKNDNEPEKSNKHKSFMDVSPENDEKLINDFKKYLPELKFASPKEKSFSTDDGNDKLCAKAIEKICEKDVNRSFAFDKEECPDSVRNQSDFKFVDEEYACIIAEDKIQDKIRFMSEIDEKKWNEAHSKYTTDGSKYNFAGEDEIKLARSSYNLTDSAHLKSERNSLKSTDYEISPQNNKVDEPVMSAIERSSRNIAGENECINNYKKYFPDFKFAASEKSTISEKDSVSCAMPSENNLIVASEKLYEQFKEKSRHSDCLEIVSEDTNSYNPLANFKYASNKSSVLPCDDETQQVKLHKKPENLLLDKSSTCPGKKSEIDVEYSNDFKKYLPDFKFGSQITRSSEDKTYISYLSDKKSQLKENALKLQAAQLNTNESVDILKDCAEKRNKDLKARITSIIKQSEEAVETKDRAKWTKWREIPHSSSSDSE